MLEYFSKNANLTLGAAGAETIIPFGTRHIQKGSNVVMSGNSAEINCCGLYNANVGVCFSGSAASDITFKLYVDNVEQPQAQRTVSIANADDYYTVDFSTYIQKVGNNTNCPCTSATNVYVTVSASVADVDLALQTTDIQIYRAR